VRDLQSVVSHLNLNGRNGFKPGKNGVRGPSTALVEQQPAPLLAAAPETERQDAQAVSTVQQEERAGKLEPAAELIVARMVAEAVGRAAGKAQEYFDNQALVEKKDRELSRLRDKLQYWERMNQEMSQQNTEAIGGRRSSVASQLTCASASAAFASALSLHVLPSSRFYFSPRSLMFSFFVAPSFHGGGRSFTCFHLSMKQQGQFFNAQASEAICHPLFPLAILQRCCDKGGRCGVRVRRVAFASGAVVVGIGVLAALNAALGTPQSASAQEGEASES